MKSKYFQVFLLIGLLPVLALAGVYAWSVLNPLEAPAPPAAQAPAPAVVNLAPIQSDLGTLASSLYNDIKKTRDDTAGLSQDHSYDKLVAFVQSHPSVSGIIVASLDGKSVKNVPAASQLTTAAYAASDEFKSVVTHLKSQPGDTYQFYTNQLSNPSFVFALQFSSTTFGEVVFNLGTLFKGLNLHGGQAYILEGKSGQYLYHTNPAQLSQTFNSSQDPVLTKVQNDIEAQQAGTAQTAASTLVYAPLFGSFGLVEEIPQTALNAAAPAAPVKPVEAKNPLELLQTPVSLAAVVVLAWVFLMFYAGLGILLGPLKKAKSVILAAAQNGKPVNPEILKQFGKDEVGQVVQAASGLLEKMEKERADLERDKEEAIRQARALIENKNKEAQQIQQQADAVKKNLTDTTQQLNDKLKELDALKGMSEGLRNQTEQSKAENAKLKTQISGLEASQADFQKKLALAESQLKESEAKLLQAVSTASPIQVSQVRSAAIKTMAEELKTTLGIIKGYVSSALGASQGGINEKQQEFLGMVINRSARLEKFINDLVDIYQVEIEQADAKTEDVNLAAEIEGLAFNFQAQAEVKNIKIKVEAKPNLPKIPIVRRRFNQLWNILYLQIIKDAPRGSSISINLESLGDMVKVSVLDPGLIVKPESLPRLFDEFYDPKHPASTQLAGTGLKFALVKTILAAHGGGAVAEPAEAGTRLILTFPSKRAVPGAASPSGTSPAVAGTQPAVAPTSAAAKPAFTIPGLTPKPPVGTSPAGTVPASAPLGPKPAVAGIPASKPTPGILDSLISGNIPPATPAPKPSVAPTPGVTPPKPPVGTSPAAAPPSLSPAPKPTSTSSAIDSLLSGAAPAAPKPPVPGAPPASTAPPLGAPKPPGSAVPGIPAAPAPGAPPINVPRPPALGVPPASAAPSLGIPRPAVSPMPGVPSAPAPGAPPINVPRPPAPGAPPASAAPPLGAPKPAVPPVPGVPAAPAPGTPPINVPRPPVPGAPPALTAPPISPAPGIPAPGAPRPAAPPMPGMPGAVAPKPGPPPIPGAPPLGAPKPPVVIPTSIKPTAPPEGILNLDNLDTFKVDDGPRQAAPRPPMPGAPPLGAPKPPPPPGDKSIVKDLNKEGEGEIIE